MTLEEVLNILHPQDRDQLRVVFSQLINKEIENGQITLRAYNEAENNIATMRAECACPPNIWGSY